jgi:hypothetical protein
MGCRLRGGIWGAGAAIRGDRQRRGGPARGRSRATNPPGTPSPGAPPPHLVGVGAAPRRERVELVEKQHAGVRRARAREELPHRALGLPHVLVEQLGALWGGGGEGRGEGGLGGSRGTEGCMEGAWAGRVGPKPRGRWPAAAGGMGCVVGRRL